MSLVQSVLKNNLLALFKKMTDGDDYFFAKQISKIIADYVETGTITTTDASVIPQLSFIGTGLGSITVQSSICESIVYAACKTMSKMSTGGSAYLASKMAIGIDQMMVSGRVETDVIGVYPFTQIGKAEGSFTGVVATLQSGFLKTFNDMEKITKDGDKYLA